MIYHLGVPPARSVLLRHDLPDGTWHFDWLIDPVGRGGDDDRTLLAFRIGVRPEKALDRFDAIRLPDHRRLYLEFEGTLPGNRGQVRRIEEYECDLAVCRDDRVRVSILGTPRKVILGGCRINGVRTDDGHAFWVFERMDPV